MPCLAWPHGRNIGASQDLEGKSFYFFFKFYIGVQPINNVVIVSGEQRRDSAIHIYVSILPQTPVPSRLPHNIEQSSRCYILGPCWFSILNMLGKSLYSDFHAMEQVRQDKQAQDWLVLFFFVVLIGLRCCVWAFSNCLVWAQLSQGMWDHSSQPGIKPAASVLKARSLSHWTSWEVPWDWRV